MVWFDIVLRNASHEISGHIAMQHSQFNFVQLGTKSLAFIIMIATPASAGTMAQEGKPDPLLDGGSTVPCAARVDYAAGIDVNGNAVVPADVGAEPVPVPPVITVPLSRGGGNGQSQSATGTATPSGSASRGTRVALDGKKLEPLLNRSACH
jgi:hypothetical protein